MLDLFLENNPMVTLTSSQIHTAQDLAEKLHNENLDNLGVGLVGSIVVSILDGAY